MVRCLDFVPVLDTDLSVLLHPLLRPAELVITHRTRLTAGGVGGGGGGGGGVGGGGGGQVNI